MSPADEEEELGDPLESECELEEPFAFEGGVYTGGGDLSPLEAPVEGSDEGFVPGELVYDDSSEEEPNCGSDPSEFRSDAPRDDSEVSEDSQPTKPKGSPREPNELPSVSLSSAAALAAGFVRAGDGCGLCVAAGGLWSAPEPRPRS